MATPVFNDGTLFSVNDVDASFTTLSLPKPIPSNGLFIPKTNIPATAFTGDTSTTYSSYVLDPAQVIGSVDAPYIPISQPAYTATLYQNIFNINNNLQNDISDASVDNRAYPTSFAVQAYVQSQISGTQILDATLTNNSNIVNTTVVNTLVNTVNNTAYWGLYDIDGISNKVAKYTMDDAENATRVGASKQVIFHCNDFLNEDTKTNLIFLDAGPTGRFIVGGVPLRYYQVTHVGDFISFIMTRNVANDGWEFLVTGYQSVFSNTININGLSEYGGAPAQVPAEP